MVVRPLKREDIPAVISLGVAMHEESQYRGLDFDPAKVAAVCFQVLEDPNQIALVIENGGLHGMLSGFVTEYDYGPDMIACDRLVYVEPEYRGTTAFVRLISAFYRWARARGAAQIYLAQTTGIHMDKIRRYYCRLGFEPVGEIYRG